MNWLAITIFAYFLLAMEVVLDKFLLSSKRVSHPAIYTFYSAVTGLFALVFIPFGFHAISYADVFFRLAGGMIFIFGMLSLFFALNKSEASRVAPVVGAVVPMTVFFLSLIFLGDRFTGREIFGILLLILGGLLISLDFSRERDSRLFSGLKWSVSAGILLAISATIFKSFYNHDNFINVYVWTRIGAFCGILFFFLVPEWRRIIWNSLLKFKNPEKEHQTTGTLYIIARAMGGLGSILKEKATSFIVASVTLVNALVSVEYVFVFLMGIGFSIWFPTVFREKKDLGTAIQKIASILIITIGIVLVFRHK
jgi:drug/metabolite transporter (DMT)-like permease